MSKFIIGNIESKNTIIGDNNTNIINNGSEKKISKEEQEVVDAILELIQNEDDRNAVLQDIRDLKSENLKESEKSSIGKKLVNYVKHIIPITAATIKIVETFSGLVEKLITEN